jgi:serine/threonine protein kinase/tetratricopeptide (TPR) repeat protein
MDIPKQIGPYQIDCRLGHGGMGVVYRAHDGNLDRAVAIKCLLSTGDDPDRQRERLNREAQILGRLEHPHIVKVHHTLEHEGSMCIVMEYVDGETLHDRIDQHGPLSVGDSVRLGRQIAEGMAVAHKHDIIHRDLKGENVLLDRHGNPKLTDFGVAKVLGDKTLTENGRSPGTLKAMSPEQIRGKQITEASDLFSFGILLYEALTGELPFKGAGLEIVESIKHDDPPKLGTRIPGVPEALSHLVGMLLQKQPSMRPPSFRDVIDRLKRIEAALDEATAALTAPPAPAGSMADGSTEDPMPLAESPAEPEQAATPVDAGKAIVSDPSQDTASEQPAADPGESAPARVSRRRRILGIFGGVGVLLVVLLGGYAVWRSIQEPAPKMLRIAVLKPDVSQDCEHSRPWVSNTVRKAMEWPLFRLKDVLVSELGAVGRTEIAEAVADEILGATVTCHPDHPDHLSIEVWRKDASGNLLKPRHTFAMTVADLGHLETIQNHVIELYRDFETRDDVSPRGQVRPEDLERFQQLSKAYWQSTLSHEQVLNELEGIRKSSPAFLDAHILNAEVLMHRGARGDLDEALQIMRVAKSITPEDPGWHPALSRLFTIALARHDTEGAETVLKEIEALDPASAFTHYLRGLLREDAQDTHGARDAMRMAAKLQRSWRILYHLAKLNMAVCDIQGAQDVLADLLASEPADTSPRALKGQLLGRIAPRSAAVEYESLPSPRDPAESFNQAINLMTLGKYREAKSLILQTMEQHPGRRNDLGAIYTLAEIEKLLGDATSAQTRFAQVLSQVPADEHRAGDMVARAMVLAHQGQFEEARQAIEYALRREDMEIYYSAAAVYALAGDADAAARWTERALDCGYAPEWFHYPWFDTIRQMPQLSPRIDTNNDDSPARP